MAQIGLKAQGQDALGKLCVRRHGGGGKGKRRRAGAARCEKALETKVRQAGKKACRDWS